MGLSGQLYKVIQLLQGKTFWVRRLKGGLKTKRGGQLLLFCPLNNLPFPWVLRKAFLGKSGGYFPVKKGTSRFPEIRTAVFIWALKELQCAREKISRKRATTQKNRGTNFKNGATKFFSWKTSN